MADTHAKDIVNKIAKGEISAPNLVSVKDCYKIAADIVLKSCQHSWSNKNTGRFTYDLIPQVGTKVTFPRNRSVGVAYTRMLLRDTMLKDDSFKTGTSDTPIFNCGMANSFHSFRECCSRCGFQPYDCVIIPVSYTHLTLPTNREV